MNINKDGGENSQRESFLGWGSGKAKVKWTTGRKRVVRAFLRTKNRSAIFRFLGNLHQNPMDTSNNVKLEEKNKSVSIIIW